MFHGQSHAESFYNFFRPFRFAAAPPDVKAGKNTADEGGWKSCRGGPCRTGESVDERCPIDVSGV